MFVPSSTLPPITYGAPPSDYHAPQARKRGEPGFIMSRSELIEFGKCPNRWLQGVKEESTADMDAGSLLDVLVLTPDAFDSEFAVYPELYPVKGMECPVCKTVTDAKTCRGCKTDRVEVTIHNPWTLTADHCKDWKAKQIAAGKRCAHKEDVDGAMRAVAALQSHPFIADYLNDSKTQVAVNVDWQDMETGIVVPFRCLIDLVPSCDSLADLKRTADAGSRAWGRTVHNFKLFYQGAAYLAAFNAATGERRREWLNIISEMGAPYECTYRPISEDYLLLGKNAFERDLADYCRCLKTGRWPGYDSAPVEPEIWMLKDAA